MTTADEVELLLYHLRDPDSAGHNATWSLETDSDYLKAVIKIDSKITAVIDFISANTTYKDNTVVIVTSDHGGEFGQTFHLLSRSNGLLDSGVVPFYVFGTKVPIATDLYSWNPSKTHDPGSAHPRFTDTLQPVRNGDAANLILELPGLPNIPGSTINNLDLP